ncbi:MAG: hypothetical protein OEY47_01380 [Candidatus Bathyarchaeota archaeon]|nr:hypothetical protein [Candidatus Bathyarchaeota archaeon]
MKVLKVSERFYALIDHGARVYGVTKKEFCDILHESHLNLIKVKCNFITLQKQLKRIRESIANSLIRKSKELPFRAEKNEELPLLKSEHQNLIAEGIQLVKEIDSEKGKDLTETLNKLREESIPEKD